MSNSIHITNTNTNTHDVFNTYRFVYVFWLVWPSRLHLYLGILVSHNCFMSYFSLIKQTAHFLDNLDSARRGVDLDLDVRAQVSLSVLFRFESGFWIHFPFCSVLFCRQTVLWFGLVWSLFPRFWILFPVATATSKPFLLCLFVMYNGCWNSG